jgi:long-chain acyl-CoA synthetase
MAESRPWLQYYPKGVPADIDPALYQSRTIVDVFEDTLRKFSSRPAFRCMGKQISYAQLDDLSKRFASYLQNDLGLKPGTKVAIQMPNVLQYPVALFGALRGGFIVVNTNPLYTPREMVHQFNDSGAEVVVILENFAANLQEALPQCKTLKHVIITGIGDLLGGLKGWIVNLVVKNFKKNADGTKMVPPYAIPQAIRFKEVIGKGSSANYKRPTVTADDLAFLQYTGGTTGVSKGAMLTHRNIVANMEMARAWIGDMLKEGEEIIVTPLPLYHIFSLTVNCLLFARYGGENILIVNPRDLPTFIKEVKDLKFTFLTGVNTLFNALLNHPDFNSIDFSRLKCSVGGAMAMQSVVVNAWKERTGSPIIEGYGLTETSPAAVFNPLDGRDRVGFIGMPLPSSDVKILDEDGKPVEQGEPGEICIKGPHVMKGYYNRPDETAKVIKDGWLHTGDVAFMTDDGYFKIVDRKKDMILVSGFNVYPNEIEEVVAAHPGVKEVAAIGVPDEKSGEAVKIVVVRKDPNLRKEELLEFCRKNLTGYKMPRHVEFRATDLPKSNVGKILRRVLRDEEAAKK